RLAGMAGACPPPLPAPAALAIFAGDHGVHARGVTPWPQEVTAQMVANFAAGGAVANAFANQVGASVTVVDVGVAADLPSAPGLLSRKVAYGTADLSQGPAMTLEQAAQALATGREIARDLVAAGHRCLITGDMGIANTTASAALIAAFTGEDPARVTGRGTGIDDAPHRHTIDVVRQAPAGSVRGPGAAPWGPVAALRAPAAGGVRGHAGLNATVRAGAATRVPVTLYRVLAGPAALPLAGRAPRDIIKNFGSH